VARALCRRLIGDYSGRLVMLCDRARILARSDRPEAMRSRFRAHDRKTNLSGLAATVAAGDCHSAGYDNKNALGRSRACRTPFCQRRRARNQHGSKADIATLSAMSALPPKADIARCRQ
jgi:hypothetical protein